MTFSGFSSHFDIPTGDHRPEHSIHRSQELDTGNMSFWLECDGKEFARKSFTFDDEDVSVTQWAQDQMNQHVEAVHTKKEGGMKLCTKITYKEGFTEPEIDISLVEPDHQFGMIDGSLHIEGSIQMVVTDEADRTEKAKLYLDDAGELAIDAEVND